MDSRQAADYGPQSCINPVHFQRVGYAARYTVVSGTFRSAVIKAG
jgi:hypothetical protein